MLVEECEGVHQMLKMIALLSSHRSCQEGGVNLLINSREVLIARSPQHVVQLQPQAVALDGALTHGINGNPANRKPVSLLPSSPVPVGLVVGELKREPVLSEAPCQMFVLFNLFAGSLGSPKLARNQAVRAVICFPWTSPTCGCPS